MSFIVVIPARYQSTRLPGKPLLEIGGKAMVQHVVDKARESGADRVIVATDDERIADAVDCEVCMTAASHESGTERLAEVVEKLSLSDDAIVVNVQGDEPFIPADNIRQVADNLANAPLAKMATLSTPLTDNGDVFNPNAVKVVTDNQGYALYFSRATIPWNRDDYPDKVSPQAVQRHIGIYAYRASFISEYIELAISPLEQIEKLEQLRVLWHGEKIHVATALTCPEAGIDTPEDLKRARQFVA